MFVYCPTPTHIIIHYILYSSLQCGNKQICQLIALPLLGWNEELWPKLVTSAVDQWSRCTCNGEQYNTRHSTKHSSSAATWDGQQGCSWPWLMLKSVTHFMAQMGQILGRWRAGRVLLYIHQPISSFTCKSWTRITSFIWGWIMSLKSVTHWHVWVESCRVLSGS